MNIGTFKEMIHCAKCFNIIYIFPSMEDVNCPLCGYSHNLKIDDNSIFNNMGNTLDDELILFE